jgi:ERCC4-related helicase
MIGIVGRQAAVLVEPQPAEAEFYRDLTVRLRAQARTATASRRLTLRSLARLAGSSPAAVAPTLAKIGWADLHERAARLTAFRKAETLVDRVRRHTDAGEKVLVFTAFRQTLDALAHRLAEADDAAAIYHGSLSRPRSRAVCRHRRLAEIGTALAQAREGYLHDRGAVDALVDGAEAGA